MASIREVDALLANAMNAHQAGQLRDAQISYRAVLRKVPKHPVALHFLGISKIQEGQADKGIELVREALRLKPDYVEAHYNLACALQSLGQFDQAAAHYDKVLAFNPNNIDAQNNLGALLLEQKRFGEAITHFEKALTINSRNPQMHSNIGLALSGLRRYDLAITHFEQSLAIDSNNVEVFCNLGNALERSNRFDEALAIYEKATLRWPNHADVNCGRGNVLARMRRLEDAIAAFCRIRSSTDIQAAHKIRARQDVFRQDAKLGLGMNREIDVRIVLPATRVPTLILHRTAEHVIDVGHARYMAQHIPGAKLIELAGEDHQPWLGDRDTVLNEVEKFLTGKHQVLEPERVLATVLFTDIQGSTERASALGDHSWRELLEAFYAKVREVLKQYRGREINTLGDGFLTAFDGPARAIRCAGAIRDAVRSLNLEVRCGLHTGECEVVGNDLAGIAVHTGARVAGLAAPGEVLVSQTVRDLVAGSGLSFEDRGIHTLEGVPNEWRLFRAVLN